MSSHQRSEPGDGLFTIPPDLEIGPSADVLPLAGETNWGMVWEGLSDLRAAADDGEGMKVCGLDTGIDRDHPLLTNCKGTKDFTGSSFGADDRNGHGTHISGTIFGSDPRIGVAPKATFYHAKVLGDSGSGGGRGIAAGIRWAAEQGCEVLSMSLGSPGEDPSITAAIKEVAEKGIWVICAAGNSGPNTPDVDWPGRSKWCISVAALGQNLAPASFTNAGAKIDTAGPGVGIWSCRPGGGFQQMSGTSMATPYDAGVLTLYRAALKKRGLPIPDVFGLRDMLMADSTDVHKPGDDNRTGPGALKAALLLLNLTADPRPVG